MSELIQENDDRATIRWKLLTGASALVLVTYVSSGDLARAEDSSQPQIWIELGGQLSRLSDGQETFAQNFPNSPSRPPNFSPSAKFEKPPLSGLDEYGKIIFQPENSDWSFAASIQFGRATSSRHVHQQTYPQPHIKYQNGYQFTNLPRAAQFADTLSRESERHLILDFQAGKDVGIGLFGSKESTSTISLGVRFAQFQSKSNVALKSNPDWHFKYITSGTVRYVVGQPYHTNFAEFTAQRSFHGVGPSLSWKSSVPIAGNGQDAELTLDWGINAAALFGKQRTRVHHQETGVYQSGGFFDFSNLPPRQTTYAPPPVDHLRTKSVTVPNIGGFAGISFKYGDAKVSLGYKADFFFGAIDGGIDAAKKENRGFYGPYASISIGLGD